MPSSSGRLSPPALTTEGFDIVGQSADVPGPLTLVERELPVVVPGLVDSIIAWGGLLPLLSVRPADPYRRRERCAWYVTWALVIPRWSSA
jgi:hypothetical protein